MKSGANLSSFGRCNDKAGAGFEASKQRFNHPCHAVQGITSELDAPRFGHFLAKISHSHSRVWCVAPLDMGRISNSLHVRSEPIR